MWLEYNMKNEKKKASDILQRYYRFSFGYIIFNVQRIKIIINYKCESFNEIYMSIRSASVPFALFYYYGPSPHLTQVGS